jgi:predicted kinase
VASCPGITTHDSKRKRQYISKFISSIINDFNFAGGCSVTEAYFCRVKYESVNYYQIRYSNNLRTKNISIILIVILCGLPGVGKTTLATNLAPLINAVVLSTDKIRKELIEKPSYRRQERRLVYDVLSLLARYLHNAGINCILDATFNTENSRKELKQKLALPSEQFSIIECTCPEDIVISRIKNRRNNYSDANISIYRKMKRIYQPVKEEHIIVDMSKPSKSNAKEVANQILKK